MRLFMDVSSTSLAVPLLGEFSFSGPAGERIPVMKLLIANSIEALTCFKDKQFSRFDAHTTDQACQIRALQVALFANQGLPVSSCIQQLQSRLSLSEKNPDKLIPQLDVKVDPNIVILVKLYLLTKTKTILNADPGTAHDYQVVTDYKKLVVDGVKEEAIKKIVDPCKKEIALNSVRFVNQQAMLLGKPPLCTRKFFHGKQEQLCFSQLTSLIFRRVIQEEIPILLKVRNSKVFFHFTFQVLFSSSAKPPIPEEPVIVIECRSKLTDDELHNPGFLQKIEKLGILEIIERNAAQHTQFTDQERNGGDELFDVIPNISPDEKERLVRLKTLALQEGLSDQNDSLCCIEHIFCDSIPKGTV